MSDYSEMSIEDLEKLKENLLSQRNNLDNTIEDVVNSIKAKNLQVSNTALRLNPYYKDKFSYLKVVVGDNGKYIITSVTFKINYIGIYQYNSDTVDFLKYYKMCTKSEWDNAVDRFNIWLKDASLKVKKL